MMGQRGTASRRTNRVKPGVTRLGLDDEMDRSILIVEQISLNDDRAISGVYWLSD
jgi:hypothetical protein